MIRIIKDTLTSREEIFSVKEARVDVAEAVRGIICGVRERGDEALLEYTEKFDGVRLTHLKVTEEEISEAIRLVEPKFLEILKEYKFISMNK